MAYTVNNFKSGDTLYASQLNKMDAQIIQNETNTKELRTTIANIAAGEGLTLDVIYPIGSIYMSINNTDPANLFGGEWEQIKDTFLLAAGNTYTAGTTGGEAEHTLTIDEMPSHSHKVMFGEYDVTHNIGAQGTYWNNIGIESNTTLGNVTAVAVGGDQPHNNMPPYLTVYMWKRVA